MEKPYFYALKWLCGNILIPVSCKGVYSRGTTELTEYDESMIWNYIKGIKIYDDHFTVSFKVGIDLDI